VKLRGYAVIAILMAMIFFGYNKWLFSLELFNLYDCDQFSSEKMEQIRSFDPDRDVLYLPDMEDKEFFESVADLSICRRPQVREFIYIYLTTGREYLKKSIERSCYYLPVIDSVLKKHGDIPAEIALLPLLESGFDPMAVSRSRATGLWQFLKGTAQRLGLRIDSWTDERRDIEKSTEAAIRHLRYLYARFGSWDLALAAYNSGCGSISRTMTKTGAKDYWSLRNSGVLSTETSQYVARYAALIIIYRHMKILGISGEISMPEAEEYSRVILSEPVDTSRICRDYAIDPEFIRRYNPELQTGTAPSYDGTYALKLPPDGAERFMTGERLAD